MIDIENQIFTWVYDAVLSEYPNAKIESVLNLSPSEFPSVYVEEIENTTYERSIDTGSMENHVYVTYEVTIYSNKTAGRKEEAKGILKIVDDIFMGLNFVRTMKLPTQIDEGTKYRLVARYRAVISKNEQIYRR